jgi:hypothetical protein
MVPPPSDGNAFHVRIPAVEGGDGPSFGTMICLVALVVATVILVFFGIGYALGRILL